MKYLSLILLIFSIVSCRQSKPTTAVIDPQFQPYVQKFQDIFGVIVVVNIHFSNDLESYEDGRCIRYAHDTNEIRIQQKTWDELAIPGFSEPQDADGLWPEREQLLFHEMGHCVLELNHDNTTTMINGRVTPVSIMYFSTFRNFFPYGPYEQVYYQQMKSMVSPTIEMDK